MTELPDIEATDAWLSSGVMDYSPAPGKLAVRDGRLVFWVVAPPGKKTARWIEEVTGQAGVAERLLAGESVTVLDIPIGDAQARFPAMAAGSALYLNHGGQKWRIYFYNAAKATGRPQRGVIGIINGRVASKPFREAFKARGKEAQ